MATITAELEQKISEFTGDPDQVKSIVQDLVASTPDAPELSLYVARKGKRGRKPHVTEEQWALWSNGEIHALVQGVDFSKPIRTMRSILNRRASMAGLKFRCCVDGTTIRVQALPKGGKFTLARTSPSGGNPSMQDQRRSILEAFARGDLTMEEACARCGGFSKQRLYQLVHKAGLELVRGSAFDLLEPNDLERFSRGEVSVRALAKKMGVGYAYALLVLNRNGINCRINTRQKFSGRPRFVLPDVDVQLFLGRGITLDQLAAKHEVHRMTVVAALRRQGGIRNPRANRFTLTESECAKLRTGSCTIGEVAEQRGVSYLTIRHAMVNQGVFLPQPADTL